MGSMFLLVGIASVLLMSAGLWLRRRALQRYAGAGWKDARSFDPRKWKPIWRMRDAFTDEDGYRLFRISVLLISMGAAGMLVIWMIGAR
ncbi:MAG TPA: hypothetical protein VFX92_00565 [Candidatus Krumholzibacteria bacterium]|nr:hypothetical protein [Candidatus Krumholzibacteria bacterium]